jgi:hypothetical protein
MVHKNWLKYYVTTPAGIPFEVYEATDDPAVADAALKAHPGSRLGTGLHDGKLPKVKPPKPQK